MPGGLDLAGLRELVDDGAVDVVEVAAVDMQGRLSGRRVPARHFLDEVAHEGLQCQSYLVATDADMGTPAGYAVASWETGYGNVVLRPDLGTLRRVPWRERSALALCDLRRPDGTPVAVAPRQVLLDQVARLEARGLRALVGAELEFMLFAASYRQACADGYRDLPRATHFGNDLSLLDTGTAGGFLDRLVPDLATAGVPLEALAGEANRGQYELVLRYGDPLRVCDDHAVTRFAAKQLAAAEGCSATFLPKVDDGAGNACHLHLSMRDEQDAPAFAGSGPYGFSPLLSGFLAGWRVATTRSSRGRSAARQASCR